MIGSEYESLFVDDIITVKSEEELPKGKKKFYCEHCDKEFTTNNNLAYHTKEAHPDKEQIKMRRYTKKPSDSNEYGVVTNKRPSDNENGIVQTKRSSIDTITIDDKESYFDELMVILKNVAPELLLVDVTNPATIKKQQRRKMNEFASKLSMDEIKIICKERCDDNERIYQESIKKMNIDLYEFENLCGIDNSNAFDINNATICEMKKKIEAKEYDHNIITKISAHHKILAQYLDMEANHIDPNHIFISSVKEHFDVVSTTINIRSIPSPLVVSEPMVEATV